MRVWLFQKLCHLRKMINEKRGGPRKEGDVNICVHRAFPYWCDVVIRDWAFDSDAVAQRCHFKTLIKTTQSLLNTGWHFKTILSEFWIHFLRSINILKWIINVCPAKNGFINPLSMKSSYSNCKNSWSLSLICWGFFLWVFRKCQNYKTYLAKSQNKIKKGKGSSCCKF